MLYTKYESSWHCSFWQKILKIAFWKVIFFTLWPTFATNWNGLNNFGRGPSRNHSCKVWSKSNRFRGKVVWMKQEGPKGPRSLTWGKGQGSQWSNLQSTTNDAIYQIKKLFSFRQEYFWKLHFKNLFLDPVTYLCNKSEPFEQIWKGLPRDHSCWVWSNSH